MQQNLSKCIPGFIGEKIFLRQTQRVPCMIYWQERRDCLLVEKYSLIKAGRDKMVKGTEER